MGDPRPGEGSVTASDAAKQSMGRGSFQRPAKYHQGLMSNEPEWIAEGRSEEGVDPTELDMKVLFEQNARTVSILRVSGLSDVQIYE